MKHLHYFKKKTTIIKRNIEVVTKKLLTDYSVERDLNDKKKIELEWKKQTHLHYVPIYDTTDNSDEKKNTSHLPSCFNLET